MLFYCQLSSFSMHAVVVNHTLKIYGETCHHENKCWGTSDMKNPRSTQDLSLLTDSLLIPLIFFTKKTQVSFFTNGHFQPAPFPLLSNAPSLTLLLSLPFSLSLPLCLFPSPFSPVAISYKYSDNFIDGVIELTWLNECSCFTWQLLTINCIFWQSSCNLQIKIFVCSAAKWGSLMWFCCTQSSFSMPPVFADHLRKNASLEEEETAVLVKYKQNTKYKFKFKTWIKTLLNLLKRSPCKLDS